MSRPIVATINVSALASNLNVARNCAPKTYIWSVIKANGYGHGLNSVLIGLKKTDGFALLDLDEAIFMREKGWQGPILLLEGFFQASDLKLIDHYRLTVTVHSSWQVDALRRANIKKPLNIYLKLNSGMNRLGFSEQDYFLVSQILIKLKQVSTVTLMSHFSHVDQYKKIASQMKIINRVSNKLKILRCLSNSAAVLWYPETHAQWVRPGIMLYGASPRGDWNDVVTQGLQPVMTLESKLIAVQTVSAGGLIGYNGKYCVKEKQLIGIVACGYGDGYPRQAPTGTPVWIRSLRTRIIGVISMDMIAIDLQPCPDVKVGEKVELWGNHIKIDEVAAAAGTTSYELMSSLSSRVKIRIL